MNRRSVFLILGAGAVVLLYLLDHTYSSWIEQPTQQLETQLEATRRSMADANAEQVAGRRLANRLDDYADRALPHDPALARAAYQKWLLELVERHQMKSASVNAETPQPIEVRGRINRRQRQLVGHTIRFTVRTRTSLEHMTGFLHEFQTAAHLHKIRSFTINPLGNGSELDLTLVVETLSLEATPRQDSLSDWSRSDDTGPSRSDYQALVKRNLFARGFSQTLAQIRLGAITRGRGGDDQAWFRVGSPAQTQIVTHGQSLELPLHTVEVRQIEAERVLIAVNGQVGWLVLGQSLGQLFGIASELEPAVDPAATSTATESTTESTAAEIDSDSAAPIREIKIDEDQPLDDQTPETPETPTP